ncbi:hypothetical protein Dsin_002556 [Dipteronia sinensis]|uniref:RNase H type-1 domain-containing protein n=1 Tax=Dipteronia sinensis TaxID=43782 RepID=A0AAE0B7F1_9ROSI|nr:hypothetical protein Dsin_002556 [Dipteronia sinensis]
MVGEVKDFDVGPSEDSTGKYLWVYERLPEYCFHSCCLGRTVKECCSDESVSDLGDVASLKLGAWLCAYSPNRGPKFTRCDWKSGDDMIQKRLDRGFKSGRFGPTVTPLFFTNDSMQFSKADAANCVAIPGVLESYAKASEQVVNYDKSALCVSSYVENLEIMRLSAILGIKVVGCHDRYLGLPCFIGRNKRILFTDVVDKILGKIKGSSGVVAIRLGKYTGVVGIVFVSQKRVGGYSGGWKTKFIRTNFIEDDAYVILSIPLLVVDASYTVFWQFDQSGLILREVVGWTESFVTDFREANMSSGVSIPNNEVVWQPPYVGSYKLNTYAAIDSDGKVVGFGTVIRDAESMSLLLASDISMFNVEAGTDAVVVHKWVVVADHLSSEVGLILTDIRVVIQNLNNCSVRFVPRNANFVAQSCQVGFMFSCGLIMDERFLFLY